MTANDNVLPANDPVARDLLLNLLSGCQDLRETTARLTETVLNALMSMQADEACGAGWGERSEGRVNSRNGYRCVLMLLYIVKGFGVLGWLVRGGDGLDPECGASFEFG